MSRNFPYLELKRQELRNMLVQYQRELRLGLNKETGEELSVHIQMIQDELSEIEYVLDYFSSSHWREWQLIALAVISILSLIMGAISLWVLL
ncbi:MAG: hypothetical protein D6800_08695 [Candidatus Zixiibacteriota bacterium]|nr:MAG: hypothetical protein D6800_08695 [candidate division Zixibacteria bacterium]